MDVYRYRSKARIVAIVDLILSSMMLGLCLILLLGTVIISTAPSNEKNTIEEQETPAIGNRPAPDVSKLLVIFMWILVVFTSVTTIIQIIAAIKLGNATQLGKEPVSALKLCTFWRHVCIVFTGLLIFSMVLTGGGAILNLVQILLRIAAIYIVTKFMNELDATIATGVLPVHCRPGTTPVIAGVAYAYIPPQQQPPPLNPDFNAGPPPPFNPDFNAAPPSYEEVVKEPPPPSFKE